MYRIAALNRSDVGFIFVKKPGDNLTGSSCGLVGSFVLSGSGMDTSGKLDATREIGLNSCGAGSSRSF